MKSERTPGKGLWAGGTPALGTSVGVMLHHAGLSPCRADMGAGELPVQQLPNSEVSRTIGAFLGMKVPGYPSLPAHHDVL